MIVFGALLIAAAQIDSAAFEATVAASQEGGKWYECLSSYGTYLAPTSADPATITETAFAECWLTENSFKREIRRLAEQSVGRADAGDLAEREFAQTQAQFRGWILSAIMRRRYREAMDKADRAAGK